MSGTRGSRTVRVALFVCDYWTKKLLEYNGDYLNMYRRWLNASLPKNSGYRLIMDAYDAQEMQSPDEGLIDSYDAILISGSSHDAWSSEEWVVKLVDFIRHVGINHPDVRLVGICFGHQIISRSLGGDVSKNPGGWEIGPTTLKTTPVGRLIYGVDRIALQEFHQDAVPLDSLAGHFASGEIYLLAQSDSTPNQGIVKFYPLGPNSENPSFKWVEYVHILTSQGHPEFDERTMTELIRQRDEKNTIDKSAVNGYFGPNGADHEHEPISKHGTGKRWGADYDGVLVLGKTFWEIFGVDYSEDERIMAKPKKHGMHAGRAMTEPKKPNSNYLMQLAA